MTVAERLEVAPASATGGGQLAEAVARRVTVALIVAHGLGALDVFALLWWILPQPLHHDWHGAAVANIAAFVLLLPMALVLGPVLGRRRAAPWRVWLRADRPPSAGERRAVLREPLRTTTMNAGFWCAAAIVFSGINAPSSLVAAQHVGTTILLGGLTTSAIGYLLVERLMRPVTALALRTDPPSQLVAAGVQGRLVLIWVFATGVPLLGLALVGIHVLVFGDVTLQRAGISVVALTVLALTVGLIAAVVSARAVAEPVCSVRDAMRRVEAGDLDVEVPVDDGSEIGLLQAGFNRMAAGLRERERLRDLFGRQVGHDVASAALLDGDIRLGGEVRDVAVLFVDLIGSTTLASTEQPERVVALLNSFFAVVVGVVDRHGGWVNKFEGDGALCIFGAPVTHVDGEAAALRAARELHARLEGELPQLRAAIGVSAGPAVAGNVGTRERFEYTVIGDPVNEAARLCDLAKRGPQPVLASETVLAHAQAVERARWRLGNAEVLRGRSAPTRLATPA
ncbi:MAG: adenylate/guanylate cyclase domain-containing protein [Thermoleophilaceae bacterium]